MNAIVLAGGEGTRLHPLTLRTPKQLLPLLGRPLLGQLLSHLRSQGVERVVLAMTRSRSGEAVRAAVEADPALGGDAPLGLELRFAYEESPLGSGGAIANALATLGDLDGPVLVCNGDLVTNIDVQGMLERHRARAAAVSIALYEVAEPAAFGVVALTADDRIARFVEKPAPGSEPSQLVNAGFWLFERHVLDTLSSARPSRVEDELFPSLATSGAAIYGYPHDGYWRDVGTPDAYLATSLELLDRLEEPLHAGAGSTIEAEAAVERTSLGADCAIAGGAAVVESVLWDRVIVERGAEVRRSILAHDVHVGRGAHLEGAVVAHGARIEDGRRLEAGAHVAPAGAVA